MIALLSALVAIVMLVLWVRSEHEHGCAQIEIRDLRDELARERRIVRTNDSELEDAFRSGFRSARAVMHVTSPGFVRPMGAKPHLHAVASRPSNVHIINPNDNSAA